MSPKGIKGGARQSPPTDPVEVYCRVRPIGETDIGGEQAHCITVFDEQTIRLIPPQLKPGSSKFANCFFTRVFDSNASQQDVFDRVAFKLVSDLISGKNGLLFTYGITGSGKTYTMTGNPYHPGLLPRCLDVIFNSIKGLQTSQCVIIPNGQNGFTVQSDVLAAIERRTKAAFFTNSEAIGDDVKYKRAKAKDAEWELRRRVSDSNRVRQVNDDYGYAVFVSYFEIYNNYIYDLLDSTTAVKPVSKALREDGKRRMFAEGIVEVEVKSTDEAFDAFIRGQKLRRVAHTVLNAESSRSHSVFNIRLVKAPLARDGTQVDSQCQIHISQLSLVDLAGSERHSRTGNAGERIKEAGHINGSLMTLRQCIEILRENQQKGGADRLVPYRDSRLTHLFKNYFDGEGAVRMIVCVNPRAADYDENLHVLQFAELIREVEIARAPEHATVEGFGAARRRAEQFIEEMKPSLKEITNTFSFQLMPSINVHGSDDAESLIALTRFFEQRRCVRLEAQAKCNELHSKFHDSLIDLYTSSYN